MSNDHVDGTTSQSLTDEAAETLDSAKSYSQLLRQQERALAFLRRILDEVDAPMTKSLLGRVRVEAKGDVEEGVRQVVAKVEDAIRAVQYCESEIHRELVASEGGPDENAPANLPVALTRFLAERKDSPGFSFEMGQDPVRGWVIRWKELSEDGTVRGAGQFYERPYAWLEV